MRTVKAVLLVFFAVCCIFSLILRFVPARHGKCFALFQFYVWPRYVTYEWPLDFTGTECSWWSWSQKMCERQYVRGRFHGMTTYWTRDGHVQAAGEYINGQRWNGTFLIPLEKNTPDGEKNYSVVTYTSGVAVAGQSAEK